MPVPASIIAREEIAKIEIGQTTIAPATAWLLALAFTGTIFVVPAAQAVGDARANPGASAAWASLVQAPAGMAAAMAQAQDAGILRRIIAANRVLLRTLDEFDDALEDESWLGRVLRPRAQQVLSGWLGAGNEEAYCGRDGWLFFRADVESLTGPGFLAPAQLARRATDVSEWTTPPQPDPRPAILDFDRQLRARGITLIVVPTPVKPTVHPEKLSARYEGGTGPLHNASYPEFVGALERAGVLVFDPTPVLAAARAEGAPQYLATDTHWRPEAMERAARALAAFIADRALLPAAPPAQYLAEPRTVTAHGDLARMLDLPEHQTLYPPETVTVRRISSPDGAPWRPSRSADVLVLGDSFSNIYSLASLGWGDSAGFIEQLAAALRRPLDRIVQNDAGAYATRELLRRDLARGSDRLRHTRLVIYQFAARELATGDWKLIALP